MWIYGLHIVVIYIVFMFLEMREKLRLIKNTPIQDL